MEFKVEKFQMSPSSSTPLTLTSTKQQQNKSSKTTTVSEKRSSQLELLPTQLLKNNKSIKPAKAGIALNFCPDGNEQLNISINGTTLNITKTSLDAIIGNFRINIDCHDVPTPGDDPLPSQTTIVSHTLGKPFHVISEDSPYVTATLSLSKSNN